MEGISEMCELISVPDLGLNLWYRLSPTFDGRGGVVAVWKIRSPV